MPLTNGHHYLTLFAFIGGLSAAIGMIVIETMALSTIFSNNVLVPMITRIKEMSFLSKYILQLRWMLATGCIAISYWYMSVVGGKYALVSMGMISFAAALQFAPLILIGLYWKKASKTGALIALGLGSSLWFYTLMIPALAKSGWMDASILENGPWGIHFLNPESLFGIKIFHYLTHSVFWTMFANIGGLIVGSLGFPQSASERQIANNFVDIDDFLEINKIQISQEDKTIILEDKILIVYNILIKYFDDITTNKIIDEMLMKRGLIKGQIISLIDLSELREQTEKCLSSYIGSSGAHFVLRKSNFVTIEEQDNLNKFYGSMLSSMNITPHELNQKIAIYQEKQKLLEQEQDLLEETILQKSQELDTQKQKTYEASKLSALGEMSAGIAHEINNPLTIIQMLATSIEMGVANDKFTKEQTLKSIAKIKSTVERVAKLIQGMKNLSRNTDGEEFTLVPLQDIIGDSLSLCEQRLKHEGIDIQIINDQDNFNVQLECRRIGLSQVFINLFNNSRDAILPLEKRWIKIEASTDALNLTIRFTDSGSGIPTNIRDKIMHPFFTTKEVGKGTGLGLSLCVTMIKEHGGEFHIDIENPNTCFVFKLPLKQNK